jgi:hypothetical protein
MIPCVVVVKDDVVDMAVVCRDAQHAEQVFDQRCNQHIPQQWKNLTDEEKSDVLSDGFIKTEGGGSICLTWAFTENPQGNYPL